MSRKSSKAPILSLVKNHKTRLDFKTSFERCIKKHEAILDDYPLGFMYEDEDAYYDAWAAFGQGAKFAYGGYNSHRSPGYQKNGSHVVKKYLGNGVSSTVITKRGNGRHGNNHAPRLQKHLWEQGFIPSRHMGSEDEVEVLDFTQPTSYSTSGLLDNIENDEKAYDGIRIYFYKDYLCPNDVEEFDNLVDFDDFVTQEGIIIPEDVTLQILQSDVVYCSIDPEALHDTGELKLVIEDSYGMLRWECSERASRVGVDNDGYGITNMNADPLDVDYAGWGEFGIYE
jgi:hypothetical protein